MKAIDKIRDNEISYCREHLVYYVRTYGHIEDKDKDELIQRFDLWEEQEKALCQIRDNKKSIILKARQLGFTWLVLHYASWLMLTLPGRTVIGLSRTEEDAKELIRRLSVIYRYMPMLIAEKGNIPPGWKGPWFEATTMSLTVHFQGKPDSVVKCFPSAADSGRSFTADLVILDEWASQAFAQEIWAAILPTVNRPTGGQVIGISTNKRGSLFESLFTGNNTFCKIFIPWYADPKRDEKWYEATKADVGEVVMAQEYPATVEEALSTPGGAFFPEVSVSSIESSQRLSGRVLTYFVMDYGLDMLAAYWIQRDTKGRSQVVQEFCRSDLTISTAAEIVMMMSERFNNPEIDGEKNPEYSPIVLYLAPGDLWSRSQETGKSRADLFRESGLNLTKSSRNFPDGCAAMKEDLKHAPGEKSRLTILTENNKSVAPELYRCLTKIQHDEKNPNIYAKKPHDLTHCVDGLRYYSVYWTRDAEKPRPVRPKKWRPDQWEDYYNASPKDQKMLIELWGDPA